ncbi:hypothetical protein [Chitinophaga nivalis]|uniref:Uncharacterized protein n=1 Tax=Chitinophaga nivalis TaxID=2991709 RepID=A0ABT3II97_9BACT|nr:hypothetical protein [Chitinophaga nivalis]MCW3466630.1 hypothetical protein [Chitinophaga nivalis]MCW3483679.1 hypothetical protein [Chitinophaga nivalis]
MAVINDRLKSLILWITYMIGITINIITEFLPLFLGKSIAVENPEGATVAGTALNTVLFFALPILLIILIVSCGQRWVSLLNVVMSSLLVLLSIYVVYEECKKLIPDQPNYAPIVMLSLMLVLSIVNFTAAWKWHKGNSGQSAAA